jgi:hypothetical protein
MSTAAISSGLLVYQWWDTDPEEPFTSLNRKEARLIQLIAKAAFPSGTQSKLDGAQAQLDRFFDLFLGQLEKQNQTLLKLLIQATDRITIPFYGSYFSNLTEKQQQSCIEDLLNSEQHLLRSAYQSLIAILGMGYTTHPQIAALISPLHRCGYG